MNNFYLFHPLLKATAFKRYSIQFNLRICFKKKSFKKIQILSISNEAFLHIEEGGSAFLISEKQ